MGVVQRFEQRLGGLVEGAFARVFKGEVQPVEIAGALKRETDTRRTVVGADRILTVNAFTVALGDRDFARLDEWALPLCRELETMVREHAGDERYSFVGPVSVELVHDPDVATGTFRVTGAMEAGDQPPAGDAAPPGVPRRPAASGQPRVTAADGGSEHVLTRPVSVIGRSPEADIRLDDPGVSRAHAELRVADDDVELVDSGSTNGSKVNGKPVNSARLRDGDRLTFGSTTLIFRRDRG